MSEPIVAVPVRKVVFSLRVFGFTIVVERESYELIDSGSVPK